MSGKNISAHEDKSLIRRIRVYFDDVLEHKNIIIPLTHTSHKESGEGYVQNQQNIQQTSIYGIQAPLIMVNDIVIDFTDVVFFDLKSISMTPEVQLTIIDRYKLITSIDTPTADNELSIQILPKFEDKYRKINLSFYITSTKITNNLITIKGSYKLPELVSTCFESFGEISTHNLFVKIAEKTKLGFASDLPDNSLESYDQRLTSSGDTTNDKRWIYCDNKSYLELLRREIQKSGQGLKTGIYDAWIDFWNYLVLLNIYERYNYKEIDENMQVWISHQNKEITEGVDIVPIQTVALLTNHHISQGTELFVENYKIINNTGANYYLGTDKVYSIYEDKKTEYLDYLIQDGDVKKDIFVNYEYMGEVYGDHNYILASQMRKDFLQKMQTNEKIEVSLNTPFFGLMRGSKVNFVWYNNNAMNENNRNILTEAGFIKDDDSNIRLIDNRSENTYPGTNDGDFIIDKSISGQYLVYGQQFLFQNNKWEYKLTLCRPLSDKAQLKAI